MKNRICSPLLCLGALLVAPAIHAQSFTYFNFSDPSGLTLNGNAATVGTGSNAVLRLTPALPSQSGSAFSTTEISLANNASFSTEFTFRFTDPSSPPADGIVFAIQTDGNNVGGNGGGLGFQGVNNSLGIEFDDFNNGGSEGDNNNGNHVAVDPDGVLGGDNQVDVGSGNPPAFANGDLWYAWIDYNGLTNQLTVSVSDNNSNRPAPIITTTNFNVESLLGTSSAFVGFTGGTGSFDQNEDVTSWQFNDSFDPIQNIGGVPDASATALLLGLGVGALALIRRRRQAIV